MSEDPFNSSVTPPPGRSVSAENAAPLEHVVDDLTPRLRSDQWAMEQVTAGATPEEVLAQLVCQGWDPETAEEIAEEARRKTRVLRGVVTREEVSRAAGGAHYRRATEFKWFSGFPTLSSLWRLLVSVAFLRRSHPQSPPRNASESEEP